MRLSQGQLNLLERCPRQFQHTYLDLFGSPTTSEQQERQAWGSRLHLLMQQRELGLPIESLVQEDAQLQHWMNAFATAAPEILNVDTNSQTIFRESEHYRTLQVQDYLLSVIYDLLIADDRQAQIFDWKTNPKLPKKAQLEKNWQTRLYLYVLAETSDYSPEQISMTYWYVPSPVEVLPVKSLQNDAASLAKISFTYNQAKHENTTKDLQRLLHKLTYWLKCYELGEPFPQIPEDNKNCKYCQFATRCQRDRDDTATSQNWLPDLADIPEVSLG
jgi:hypothetical protein